MQDELIGHWHREDDGSGLIMMFDFGIVFHNDGTGISYSRGMGESSENNIFWRRIDKETIEITYADDLQWETVSYKISICEGAYSSFYKKLVQTNSTFYHSFESPNSDMCEDFYDAPEPLFQSLGQKEKLTLLGYDSKWITFGILTYENLINQISMFLEGKDKNTEHYRYRTFIGFLASKQAFSDVELENFIELICLDEDKTMVGSVVKDLLSKDFLTVEQYQKVKEIFITFGEWTIKAIQKIESKRY